MGNMTSGRMNPEILQLKGGIATNMLCSILKVHFAVNFISAPSIVLGTVCETCKGDLAKSPGQKWQLSILPLLVSPVHSLTHSVSPAILRSILLV